MTETASESPPATGTGLVADAIFLDHDTGYGHPEQPARFTAVRDRLAADGLLDSLAPVACRPVTEEELLRCHTADYLATVRRDIAAGMPTLTTGDTDVSPESEAVARQAAGGVIDAVDAVCRGALRNAFCAVRPPGHHATPDRGMGFCLFNSAAVAARAAQQRDDVDRVVIVDWDVHHGNGTQDIFYEDGTVMYCSTHQHPWYPGTGARSERGAGEGEGTTLNEPMQAGSGGAAVCRAFDERFLPAMESFDPDLVIVSAGFDSRRGDPLGQMLLNDDDFVRLTGDLLGIAKQHAGGRLVSVLEGGYALEGLASAVAAHVGALVAAV